MYCAEDEWGAFIETFGQATGMSSVTSRSLVERPVARLDLSRPLTAIDLFASGGLARVGADARLGAGDHDVARRWSLRLWQHPINADAIAFGCRHDPARTALAIFDRAASVFSTVSLGSLMDRKGRLAEILETYDFGLIDS